MSSEIERVFFMIRSGLLTPQIIQQIVTDYKEGFLEGHRKSGRKKENRSQEYRERSLKYREQLRQRDYSEITEEASDNLAARKIDFNYASSDFTTLCDGLLRTKMRVFEVMSDREDGNLSNGYDDGLLMRVRERKPRLTEMMDDYIIMNRAGWKPRASTRVDGNFKKIKEILGNVCTCDITKDLSQHLYNEIKSYPVNRDKNPYKDLTLEECRNIPQFTPLALDTAKGTWSLFSSLMCFGYENEKYGVKRNYATDKTFKFKNDGKSEHEKRSVYDQFDVECLLKGLSQVNRVRQPQRYWIPLVGLFQGMRLNEICQLYCDDILQKEGIDCIRITDNPDRNQKLPAESNLQSVKNASSRRTIPIHPALIELGFLDFVEVRRNRKYKRVWENLETPAVDYYAGSFGHYMSKWYCGTFRKKHITNEPKLKPFHSLRHTFIDWHFQNVRELDFSAIKGLVGHFDTQEQLMLGALFNAETWRTYAKEMNPARLLESLSKLDYGVDLGLLSKHKS